MKRLLSKNVSEILYKIRFLTSNIRIIYNRIKTSFKLSQNQAKSFSYSKKTIHEETFVKKCI